MHSSIRSTLAQVYPNLILIFYPTYSIYTIHSSIHPSHHPLSTTKTSPIDHYHPNSSTQPIYPHPHPTNPSTTLHQPINHTTNPSTTPPTHQSTLHQPINHITPTHQPHYTNPSTTHHQPKDEDEEHEESKECCHIVHRLQHHYQLVSEGWLG